MPMTLRWLFSATKRPIITIQLAELLYYTQSTHIATLRCGSISIVGVFIV